jgi:hypothetical protein
MAKKLSYTNPTTGTISPDSYWIPVQINLDVVSRRGIVLFCGWNDQAARSSGLQGIGHKAYDIDSAAYEMFFSPMAMDSEHCNAVKAAYLFASSVLDVPAGEENVSFFDGATDC